MGAAAAGAFAAAAAGAGGGVLESGSLRVDLERHEVTLEGRSIDLTPTEFRLLSQLAQHPGRVYSREDLLRVIWGDDFFGDERTVDVHVRHLREKVEPDPAHPQLILTVRGVGYRFSPRPQGELP